MNFFFAFNKKERHALKAVAIYNQHFMPDIGVEVDNHILLNNELYRWFPLSLLSVLYLDAQESVN